jgi:hypothetical protein
MTLDNLVAVGDELTHRNLRQPQQRNSTAQPNPSPRPENKGVRG